MSTKHFITYKRYERDHQIGEYRDPDRKSPPWELIDEIAEQKFSGGFDLKRKNLCTTCYEYRSVTGTCGCD